MQGRTALLILVVSAPGFAHHGVAPHYDASKPVHLEGVVAKFDFINPHSFLPSRSTASRGTSNNAD